MTEQPLLFYSGETIEMILCESSYFPSKFFMKVLQECLILRPTTCKIFYVGWTIFAMSEARSLKFPSLPKSLSVSPSAISNCFLRGQLGYTLSAKKLRFCSKKKIIWVLKEMKKTTFITLQQCFLKRRKLMNVSKLSKNNSAGDFFLQEP